MSAPKPIEEQILAPARRVLERVTSTSAAQLDVLEAVASRLGGFSLQAYRSCFDATHNLSARRALEAAGTLLGALSTCPIHPSLGLSALARPQLSKTEQRASGAYYTDFRLAQHVVDAVAPRLRKRARIIDPASGTGMLLVAASIAACGLDRVRRASWLAESVTAWDLSPWALRGARLALASLTDDMSAIRTMVSGWRCHDSLTVNEGPWGECDIVVGNPPWEKVKLTRHEFLRANGHARHYGDDYEELDGDLLAFSRAAVAQYSSALVSRYPLLGNGEPDLYKAFLELFLKLARPSGLVSVLVPAGLIRSQGTQELRKYLFDCANELCITIVDNRARFFAIDTRFKFVGLALSKANGGALRDDLCVVHARGAADSVVKTGMVRIGRKALQEIRPGLTVPEVRSEEEWRLFRSMSQKSVLADSYDGALWDKDIVREVDMTRDRSRFSRTPGVGRIPLVEGRMVHQYRFGAKAYRAGTGRRARWDKIPLGVRELTPQFWYPRERLARLVSERVNSLRVGFCDITGQTNERSMLAAVVPSGVVCGNKVPTVRFPNDPSDSRLFLWVAVLNSIPFDWALRRIVTTTVNYFLLKSVPFPALQPNTLPGRRLVAAARELSRIDEAGSNTVGQWRTAELRASIDIAVLKAYGLGFADLELMLRDFPLLDRGQVALVGEERSTVTRDFLLARAALRFRVRREVFATRLRSAREVGAVPYVPSEFISGGVSHLAEAGNS